MAKQITRREFVKAGAISLLGATGVADLSRRQQKIVNARSLTQVPGPEREDHFGAHGGAGMVGEVDHEANGFNPTDILTDFDFGTVSMLPDGQVLREYEFVAVDQTIEVAPGIEFPGWSYNSRIPGPTIRCDEGDRIKINFTNGSSHPHTIHFHGVHPHEMDGVPGAGPGLIQPGSRYTYEFDAIPFGLHLYHCHAFPLARHIAKGLYGAFIVDPPGGRPPVDHEFMMMMNGIDVDFDDANDFYAVNTIPFHFHNNPIRIKVGETVRIYLVNILEFDLLNSFHLHAEFFHYYPTGTSLEPAEFTDTIIQGQAQRGILEFSYRYPGQFMFHAHVTEFAELGWSGLFEVLE